MIPLQKATDKAIARYASRAEQEHLRLLREERRLATTECAACARVMWPARDFCPSCGGDAVRWIDVGAGATLYAFTQQHRSLRFATPEVIGIVEVPRVGRIVSAIDAPFEDLRIGVPLEVDFVEVQPELWVHRFKPSDR